MPEKTITKMTAFLFGSTSIYPHWTFTEWVINNWFWYTNIPDVTESYREPLDLIVIFIHNWRKFMSDCVSNQYVYFSYIYKTDLTASFGAPFGFIMFFLVFSYIIDGHSCLKYCMLYKLSWIVRLAFCFYYNNIITSKTNFWLPFLNEKSQRHENNFSR